MKKIYYLLIISIFIILVSCSGTAYTKEPVELPIPPMIDSKELGTVDLLVQKRQHEFFGGIKSDTMGYGGENFLGPTIKLYKGQKTNINIINKLDDDTTLHSHGLLVPGNVDGGPSDIVRAGQSKINIFVVEQAAGTSWYHPHLMSRTAEQVFAGLAGVYYIEDENSASLDLPKNYGVNDFPLILQDRDFKDGKMIPFQNFDSLDVLRLSTLVVNGKVNTFKKVPKGWVRLRLVNGSNAWFYHIYFKDKRRFYKIATDGGFLNAPMETKMFMIHPGERVEIMVDFSDGKDRELMAKFSDHDDIFTPKQRVLLLQVDESLPTSGTLVRKLNNIENIPESAVVQTRAFVLDDADDNDNAPEYAQFTINGKYMDTNMERIDTRVKKGSIEKWIIISQNNAHPFHIHGVFFQVLARDGKKHPMDTGWKDTVLVGEGEKVELLITFTQPASEKFPYMYHCHILRHEDGGMMGQFIVE